MSIKWSDLPDTVTAKPLQPKDIVVFSNTTDGGTTFDVSKQGFVEQFVDYIIANGFAFAEDIIVTGTGTGIGESTMMAADLDLDGGLYLGHKDYLSFTEFLAYIDPSDGGTIIRTPSTTSMSFTVGSSAKMTTSDSGVHFNSGSGNVVLVGLGHGILGTDSRFHVKGLGNTDATNGLTVSNSTGGDNHTFVVKDNQRVGILVSSPTALLDLGASTTDRPSLNFTNGTAPTVPVNGNMYMEGNVIKFKSGGVEGQLGASTGSPTQMPYTFDIATADADPTAGKLRFNNVVNASVTEIYIDDLNKDGLDMSTVITDVSGGASIQIQQSNDTSKSVIFAITAAVVDGSGYWKITVVHGADGTGGNIDDAAKVEVFFDSQGAFNRANAVGIEQITGGIITPTQLTANVEDYNPTGFSTANMIRLDVDANNRGIGGFLAPPAGINRIIHVNNINASGFDTKYFFESAGSAAINRILPRDGADRATKPNDTSSFWYDHIKQRWIPFNRIG